MSRNPGTATFPSSSFPVGQCPPRSSRVSLPISVISLRYRAISYDPRGQGLTSKTVEGHSYQQHGRDLQALIAALHLKRIVLVGWSFGVLDAMAYLDQFGADNVRALVILDGTPKPKGNDPATEWVETEELRRWSTITPIEDRARFHHEFAQVLLEDASPENIEWITEISAQTSATVTALLNETARHVDYESSTHRDD